MQQTHHHGLLHAQVQQQVQQTQQLLEPEFRLQGGASKPASVAPLVLALHLRMQQSMMMRLVHHLAVEVCGAAAGLARGCLVLHLCVHTQPFLERPDLHGIDATLCQGARKPLCLVMCEGVRGDGACGAFARPSNCTCA